MTLAALGRPRRPRCPTCGAPVTWPSNPHRPFCSLSCRLVDLGVWLDERYRLRGEALPDLSGDAGEPGGRTGRAAPDAGA